MVKPNIQAIILAFANSCMSVAEAAEAAGISTGTISRIKKGYLVRPEYIGKLAKVLGVDAVTLILFE